MRSYMHIVVLSALLICLCHAQRPSPFASQAYDNEDYDGQAQTQVDYRAKLYDYNTEEEGVESRQAYSSRNDLNQKNDKKRLEEEELEEEEQPDKLTLLLEKSRFNCDGKTTGYYADDSLACEVFHYCQDNQRHSWICPEGFKFHQVHLICMPPTGENICEESSKYHIVNDYLYKPINVEEHQTKPNVTLKYSDRYYPENYYQDEQQNYEDEQQHQPLVHRQPFHY